MKVRVDGESMITINDKNYYGGQEIELTEEEYKTVEDKVDVITTSTTKTKTKKQTTEDNIETEEEE